MTITADQVRHVAKLARLEIAPESVEKLASQLAAILEYVEKLSEVETRDIPSTSHAIDLTNAFRDDDVCHSLSRDAALDNAPSSENGSFVVPKVI